MTAPEPGQTAIGALCEWCVIDGRCVNGKLVSWSNLGRHEIPCSCQCHSRTALAAALAKEA